MQNSWDQKRAKKPTQESPPKSYLSKNLMKEGETALFQPWIWKRYRRGLRRDHFESSTVVIALILRFDTFSPKRSLLSQISNSKDRFFYWASKGPLFCAWNARALTHVTYFTWTRHCNIYVVLRTIESAMWNVSYVRHVHCVIYNVQSAKSGW